jgi:hypothetical protein
MNDHLQEFERHLVSRGFVVNQRTGVIGKPQYTYDWKCGEIYITIMFCEGAFYCYYNDCRELDSSDFTEVAKWVDEVTGGWDE